MTDERERQEFEKWAGDSFDSLEENEAAWEAWQAALRTRDEELEQALENISKAIEAREFGDLGDIRFKESIQRVERLLAARMLDNRDFHDGLGPSKRGD